MTSCVRDVHCHQLLCGRKRSAFLNINCCGIRKNSRQRTETRPYGRPFILSERERFWRADERYYKGFHSECNSCPSTGSSDNLNSGSAIATPPTKDKRSVCSGASVWRSRAKPLHILIFQSRFSVQVMEYLRTCAPHVC